MKKGSGIRFNVFLKGKDFCLETLDFPTKTRYYENTKLLCSKKQRGENK